jgi:hypothetical protein
MTRKFNLTITLSEEEARHLLVLEKEFHWKPADTVRRALDLYFSKPLYDIVKGGSR